MRAEGEHLMRRRLAVAIATAGLGLALAAPAQGASGTWDRAWGKK
jgi:hypothetical protein